MTEPDIVRHSTEEMTITTVIQSVEITRTAADGGWRIALPLTDEYVLASGATVSMRKPTVAFDLSDLSFDPTVQQLYAVMRDVTIKLARGDLKPREKSPA